MSFIDFADVKARCSGEQTGYIGITEAKTAKAVPPSNVATFPKSGHLSQEDCLGSTPRNAGFSRF
jgi:hypothetical protein